MTAPVRLAAASAVAAALLFTGLPAQAADLWGPGYGSKYDRYGEYYGDRSVVEESYADTDDFEGPYRHAYKDKFRHGYKHGYKKGFSDDFADDDDDFGRHYDRYARNGDDCVPRHVAHERIRAEGWRDFGEFEARGKLVYMQARRPSGRLFDLTVDTCSGEIVEARPLYSGRSYAGNARRHWPSY